MDSKILISVIVPVYNGEKTLRRAVESVLCQMDGRIELILVDDGSKDESGAICDEYVARCPDIHVIHKANGGTSSAKNMGIAIAKGQYLSFMDCDDYFDSDTYGSIIPILQEYQPDCLDFGLKYINQQGEVAESLHQCPKNILLSRQVLEELIFPPLLNLRKDDAHFIFDFCCNKMFKAEIIREHDVRFDEEKRTWEDRTFLLRHLKYCQNYYAMDRCFYNYVYTPNSLSQRYSLDYFKIILANFKHYKELFEDRFDFDTQYAIDYRVRSIENMIFRSLEQTENTAQIRNNILETLSNPQVVHWFSKRNPGNEFERKVSELIVAGNVEEAVRCYKKQVAQNQRKNKLRAAKVRIGRMLRKLTGR